jgi:hypothetical protein
MTRHRQSKFYLAIKGVSTGQVAENGIALRQDDAVIASLFHEDRELTQRE